MSTDQNDDAAENDSPVNQYQVQHDWSSEDSITSSIIEGVEALSNERKTDIKPLYETVDPDALDQLITSLRGNEHGEVQFVYADYKVTVDAHGSIEIQDTQ